MAQWIPSSGNGKHLVPDDATNPTKLGPSASVNVKIIGLNDLRSAETTFEIGETVTAYTSNTNGFIGTFAGTITVDGTVYPVLRLGGNQYFVAGIPANDPVPNLGPFVDGVPSNIDSSGSFTVCFFPGTMISTPSGECRIEDLSPGDPVLIGEAGPVPASWFGRIIRRILRMCGFEPAVRVKWIGRQTVSTRFGPADRMMPVRFAAGSLGGGGNIFCRIAF